MERPTAEQVKAARERLTGGAYLPDDYFDDVDIDVILTHLDAVTAERDANQHELDQLVQETLIPLQKELAEVAYGYQDAHQQLAEAEAALLLAWDVASTLAADVQWMSGSPSFSPGGEAHDGYQRSNEIRQRMLSQAAELADLPAVKRAMEANNG